MPYLLVMPLPSPVRAVAGHAIDLKTLLAAFQQLPRDGQRIDRHKIGRARDAPGVDRRIFVRINRFAIDLENLAVDDIRAAARHRPGGVSREAMLIGKKFARRLRAHFVLPHHVGKQFDRRPARVAAAQPADAHHRRRTSERISRRK